MFRVLSFIAMLLPTVPAGAAILLSEDFDDISTLPVAGWVQSNNSSPLGTTDWFQGNAGVFSSHSGAPDSYIAANFLNADFGGNISNWLLTPTLTINNGDAISFYTRTESPPVFADSLEVRLSTNGVSADVGATDTSVGDFTNLMLQINPSLTVAGYPSDWTQFTAIVSGIPGPLTGRYAFRYFVPDTSANADYIGIDTVTVDSQLAAVPEPGTFAILLLGVAALIVMSRWTHRTRAMTLGVVMLTSGSMQAMAASTIVLLNANAAGVGFNDPTPVAPVGGNPGTTMGQQRLNAVQYALNIWGAALTSTPAIVVSAEFSSISCTATNAVLGVGRPEFVYRDFAGAPLANTWYPAALANKLSGTDLSPTSPEIRLQLNVGLGQATCMAGAPFYLGLDNNVSDAQPISLVLVVLREVARGLGASTFTNVSTGALQSGFPNVYDHFVLDTSVNKTWAQMTDSQRVASAINTHNVVWSGASVTTAVPTVLSAGTPTMVISAPATVAGQYVIGTANFGPSNYNVTGDLMPVVDVRAPGPACNPLVGLDILAVNGNIALINSGGCGATVKVKNAQNAGAIGVVLVNNVPGAPPNLSGIDPTITIPVVHISQADGDALKAALRFRSRTKSGVRTTLMLTQRAGADALGRMLLYAPSTAIPGSSIVSWDPSASPNLLLEHYPNALDFGDAGLTNSVQPPFDLTLPLLRDIGWVP